MVYQLFWTAFDMPLTGVPLEVALGYKNIHDVLVSETILVYCIWNMVCGIWYENGIHSVFTYVLCASCLGCLQCSASIPCNMYNLEIDSVIDYEFNIKTILVRCDQHLLL